MLKWGLGVGCCVEVHVLYDNLLLEGYSECLMDHGLVLDFGHSVVKGDGSIHCWVLI